MTDLSRTILLWADVALTVIIFVIFTATQDPFYGIGAVLSGLGWLALIHLKFVADLNKRLDVLEALAEAGLDDEEDIPIYLQSQLGTFVDPKRRDLRGNV